MNLPVRRHDNIVGSHWNDCSGGCFLSEASAVSGGIYFSPNHVLGEKSDAVRGKATPFDAEYFISNSAWYGAVQKRSRAGQMESLCRYSADMDAQ
ncbi:hypothetical protein [Agathobaculum sp. Marseille-P7918]|uniref:hypothetical protein n=1 Tax=Agathobaculum sp. Marseille-P7918 TaxID=2479843 RepID=UPI000F6445D3|nr:hypothetical protein [Agathobaculum sp. Marseille-P7918]